MIIARTRNDPGKLACYHGPSAMKVLVTGAAGRLGSEVCRTLQRHGHEVRGTDRRFRGDLGVELRIADLTAELDVYRLVEGMDAVVHCGNHPHLGSGPSPQAILANNTAMNANVFRAAVDVGVRRLVFASSIQAMVRLEGGARMAFPYTLPYFPLDGDAPPNPGGNLYGLSKEFGERLLQTLVGMTPDLSATALRFPMLTSDVWLGRFEQPVVEQQLNFWEGLTYLMMEDAAELTAAVLAREAPGYHQYFPAQYVRVNGFSTPEVLRRYFPETPLRLPIEQISGLVDLSRIETALSWRPAAGVTAHLRP